MGYFVCCGFLIRFLVVGVQLVRVGSWLCLGVRWCGWLVVGYFAPSFFWCGWFRPDKGAALEGWVCAFLSVVIF